MIHNTIYEKLCVDIFNSEQEVLSTAFLQWQFIWGHLQSPLFCLKIIWALCFFLWVARFADFSSIDFLPIAYLRLFLYPVHVRLLWFFWYLICFGCLLRTLLYIWRNHGTLRSYNIPVYQIVNNVPKKKCIAY